MATAFSNADRAEVLTQALPYFKKYYGKTVVVKYGGNAMLTEDLQQQVMEDIVLLHLVGVRVVLVHGGGPEITGMLKRVGKESQFVNGLRVTDKETVEIAQMVLAGKINKTLVTYLEAKGGSAIGLSGMDGRMITAKMKDPALGYVGEPGSDPGSARARLYPRHLVPRLRQGRKRLQHQRGYGCGKDCLSPPRPAPHPDDKHSGAAEG